MEQTYSTKPKCYIVKYAIKLDFSSTDNKAKYKVFIAELGLVIALRTKNLKICGDSRLVVHKLVVTCEYETNNEHE